VIKVREKFRKINHKAEELADLATEWFGTPLFLLLNILFWTFWIVKHWNIDEFTLIVSLQAILMSILILNAANRQQRKEREIAAQDRERDEIVQDHVEDIHDDVERIKNMLDEMVDEMDG
jgi:uncharacterized membrane protein